MKQHITVEQFKELPVKIRKKLVGHSETGNLQFELWEKRESHYLQLTIGKMIEILDNSTHTYDIKRSKNASNWIVLEYTEHKSDVTLDDRFIEFRYENKELCDVLWEAVKEVL